MPPPSGKASVIAHLPALASPACCSMAPSIHEGQTFVANVPARRPAFPSSAKAVSPADWPCRTAVVTWFQAAASAVFVSNVGRSCRSR